MGGGYSAVDMALHGISGKVYNVPAYRLVGNKVRDKIRIYADTTDHKNPKGYAERMRRRKEMGLTYFQDGPAHGTGGGAAGGGERARRGHGEGLGYL